ncbi:FAD-binding oxidoreductase [Candidimonas sp. SYP-B2681]|uniref:NAD(P)/FAD-dependent oxidoreductase n=1 Tax=Candidimonas sp. SYP-B2681 TaxID=2497686 RepID=UPI001F195A1F|nr:FAD-binding oxidoreductase [Candidimonas sp. SYP-B2681]
MEQKTFDVVIIGGGIHGCASAFFLARRGLRVAVLEADYCGRHASGVNAGGVRTLGRPLAETHLTLASCDLWHDLKDLIGDDAGFVAQGQIKVSETDDEVQILRDRVSMLQSHGFTHEVLVDKETVRELVPAISDHVTGAIWVERDGFALPYRAVTAFRRAAEAHGAVIHENCRVENITQGASKWRATTNKGIFEAEYLVVAAGAWSGYVAQTLGETVPVTPGGLMLMVTQRLPHFIEPVVGATSRGLSFKQYDNGTVVIGGELHCGVDIEAAHAELDFSRLANSAKIVTDLFPFLEHVSINRAWSGIEGFTPDHTPILGPSTAASKLIYACGFSSSGFQLGPASGRAVSELILDGASQVQIDGLSLSRFSKATAL